MVGTPVAVVFFNMPVANPDKDVPFIFTTVAALPLEVISPVKFALVVTVVAFPVTLPVTFPVKLPVKVPAIAPVPVIVGDVSVLFVNVWVDDN